jgi:zinc protease
MKHLILSFAAALALAGPARAEVDIQEVTSAGGITAWLVEDSSIPFVALEARFRGGASLDAEDKRGAANLMAALLEEGTGDLDARGFARALEGIAADFSYDASDDSISVSARFLTETRDTAVDLLRRSITEPAFAEDAIERVRAQVLSGIASDGTDPNSIASQTFERLAFPGHPYGGPVQGTEETVSALTRDDLVTAWQGAMARDRLYVSAVGDITPEALAEMLDTVFGALPETGAPMAGPAPYALEPGVTVVDYDVPQSVALFGQPGMERDDPDFLAAFVLNSIIGGSGFEARLMQEVREERGLTYGIGSFLVPKDHAALYMGQFSTANDRMAEAIDVVKAEWARAADGVTAEELQDAKTYLTGNYPLRFDGNARIANILVGMQLDDMPMDYVVTRNDQVNALTLEKINDVAAELFDPEALSFVVVGQPEGIDGAMVTL